MPILALLLLISQSVFANITVQHAAIPGGVAVIDFETKQSNPKVFYGDRQVYVQPVKGTRWQALVGIPLQATIGEKYIRIENDNNRTITFAVEDYHYKEQHITLTGNKKKYVNPNLDHMDRISKERPILSNARKTFFHQPLAKGRFSVPVKGITTSPFGLKRFYNGEPRRPHTGLDYAGDIGTPIMAPADGKVILTGDFFFNGNTVFLDHGQGLISVYIHMNSISAKPNEMIKRGDILGTIGQTGRSTGPHLHWGVYLNQVAVNPALFLQPKDNK